MLSDFLQSTYAFSYKINNFTDFDLQLNEKISICADFLLISRNITPDGMRNFLEINIYWEENKSTFSYLGGKKYNLYITSTDFTFTAVEEDYRRRLKERMKSRRPKNLFNFFKLENEFEDGLAFFYLKDYRSAYEKFKKSNYELAVVSQLLNKEISIFTSDIREGLIEQLKSGGDQFLIMRVFLLNYFFDERIENLLILFSHFMDLHIPHKTELTVFLLLLLLPMMGTKKFMRLKKYFLFKLAVLYYENGESSRSEQILLTEPGFSNIKFSQ